MSVRGILRLGCAILLLGLTACQRPGAEHREYQLRGQILAVGGTVLPDGRREVSVKHEDIQGFMPAMTMAYFVRKASELDGMAPGDLVTARLVRNGGEVWLEGLKKTGHADLPPDAHPVKAMDVMEAGEQVPDDPLQDQEGRTRRLSDWRGKALAVTFVYTRCPLPDFCPLMDRHFADLQRAIDNDARLRDRAHLVSVSFDPEHDTPSVIASHAKLRGADARTWSYLTGNAAAVEHLTSRFGVSAIVDKDSAQSITHNLRTAVVDAHGRLVKVYTGNEWTVEALLADLRDAAGR